MSNSSPSEQKTKPPPIKALIADWDDTITTKDTIELVAEAAYITNPSFPKKWDYFCDHYFSNYKEFTKQFGERETILEEVDFQKGLRQVELSSVNEYVGLGLFRGVNHDTFRSQSSKVGIKPNFFETFKLLYEKKIPVIILSCNWTSIMMEKIFKDHGFIQNDHFKIVTNEFEHIEGSLTGDVKDDRCIRTGVDKVKHVTDIKQDLNEQGINDGIYYIGDSCTDVLPMLEVDYGLVIGDGSAMKTLERLRIGFSEGVKGCEKVMCIHDWKEIVPLI